MPSNNYIEYTFTFRSGGPMAVKTAIEILMAELAELNFESFVEKEEGLLAYIPKRDWEETILKGISIMEAPGMAIDFGFTEIEQENWNAVWEQNFEPIEVEDRCRVRAPFHKKLDFEYDIVIEPKMSFGTGHHQTTQMMLRHILANDFYGDRVLDMGCGTGVLAILAEMKGALAIDAIDIDHWCYLNARENVGRNGCQKIQVLEGDSNLLVGKCYDRVLANINRNALLEDIPVFSSCLASGGSLFLSGFYFGDIPPISDRCRQFDLTYKNYLQNGDWVAVEFTKQ